MTYTRILIDNFNGAALDIPKRWTAIQGPGYSQSFGTLNMACVMDYPMVKSTNYFRLSTGIFAAKLTATGTRIDGSEFYIGARDAAGNHIAAVGSPNGAYITFSPGGLATFTDEVKTDTTVGLGPSWVNGRWWGIGNMSADNVLRMYNSKDGQVWNEMARCTVGGTFDRTNVAIMFQAGIWNGSTTDLTAKFDDASFWLRTARPERTAKIRSVNDNWIYAEPRVLTDGVWVSSIPKHRETGIWRAPK